MNPLLHVQVKELSVSVHVALWLQGCMESHSLISVKSNLQTCLGKGLIALLSQVSPSPMNPLLHEQMKEPRLSVHEALM